MIIKTIGIMTGNSLDAADAVLSVFDDDGGVCDLAAFRCLIRRRCGSVFCG